MNERSDHRNGPDQAARSRVMVSEHDAWGMVSTLVAGPVVWGLIGAGVDLLAGTHRVFLAVGVVVGFVMSFYITYFRYGRL